MSEFEEEIIGPDDLIETVDKKEIARVVAEVSAANALVVYIMQPPEELGEREKEIWGQVMDSVVPGHLSDKDIPSLSIYCRCIAEIEFCDAQIEKIKSYSNFDPLDKAYFDGYKTWSNQRRSASALALRMATSMRLTNQAFRQDNKKVNTVTASNKLWSEDDE